MQSKVQLQEVVLRAAVQRVAGALAALDPPSDAVMYLERSVTTCLSDAERQAGVRLEAYDAGTDWSAWHRGRVFCPAWELRWEAGHALYTGPHAALEGFEPLLELTGCRVREGRCMLWGERDGAEFTEMKVPRRFRYPLSTGRRAALRVREWWGPQAELLAARAVGLEAMP